ncbi:accessory Sec system protein Asp1 [Macrococcus capreoli]
MKYFIPAWYSDVSWWRDKAMPHFHRKQQSEFDDMISLLNMYKQHQSDFQVIQLNYHPDFRSFMHRNHLYEARYWSVFDEIQGFTHMTPQPIDFTDLGWPDGTEFIYTAHYIKAIVNADKYYHVYFNQQGFLVWVESYEMDVLVRRYIFDDRGMLSSIRLFESGEQVEIHYLSIVGDTVLIEYIESGKVVVTPEYYDSFKRNAYDCMNDLIEERFSQYVKAHLHEDDQVIVSSDARHNDIIKRHTTRTKVAYSLFTKRNAMDQDISTLHINHAKKWIVDTEFNERKLLDYKFMSGLDVDILRITPFDANAMKSKSNEMYYNYIGIMTDDLSHDELAVMMTEIEHYLKANKHVKFMLISRSADLYQDVLHREMARINQYFIEQERDFEDFIAQQIIEKEKIKYKRVPFEKDLLGVINELRLIVDLSAMPDLYLQIKSIGAGIPQVNRVLTDYITVGINGVLIDKMTDLPYAFDYYLGQLKPWNHAYTHSLQLVEKYSSKNIIESIDRFIEGDAYEGEI